MGSASWRLTPLYQWPMQYLGSTDEGRDVARQCAQNDRARWPLTRNVSSGALGRAWWHRQGRVPRIESCSVWHTCATTTMPVMWAARSTCASTSVGRPSSVRAVAMFTTHVKVVARTDRRTWRAPWHHDATRELKLTFLIRLEMHTEHGSIHGVHWSHPCASRRTIAHQGQSPNKAEIMTRTLRHRHSWTWSWPRSLAARSAAWSCTLGSMVGSCKRRSTMRTSPW